MRRQEAQRTRETGGQVAVQISQEKTQLVTMLSAASRLSISKRTLERLVRDGDIVAVRVGERRLAIEEIELARFVAARRATQTAPPR